jgi:hypothetical protein
MDLRRYKSLRLSSLCPTPAGHRCSLYFFQRYSSAPTPSCISFEGVKNFKWHRRQTARVAVCPRYFRIENPVSSTTTVARPNPDPWELAPPSMGNRTGPSLGTRLTVRLFCVFALRQRTVFLRLTRLLSIETSHHCPGPRVGRFFSGVRPAVLLCEIGLES